MSYGVKWRLEYTDELSRDKRVDILKKGYTGEIQSVTGATFSPVHISMQNQGDEKFETIKGTEIEVKLFSELQFDKSEFNTGDFYALGRLTSGDDTDYGVRKVSYDETADPVITSYDILYDFQAEGQTFVSGLFEARIDKLPGGNILVTGAESKTGTIPRYIYLFDESLTLIDSATYNFVGGIGDTIITADNDGNIYIADCSKVSGGAFYRIRKYSTNGSLALEWTSSEVKYSNSLTPSLRAGIVYYDDSVIMVSGATASSVNNINKLSSVDGSVIDTVNDWAAGDSQQSIRAIIFDNKKIAISRTTTGTSGAKGFWVYSTDLVFEKFVSYSSLGMSSMTSENQLQAFKDKSVLLSSRGSSRLSRVDLESEELIFNRAEFRPYRFDFDGNNRVLEVSTVSGTNDSDELGILNIDTGSVIGGQSPFASNFFEDVSISNTPLNWQYGFFGGIEIDFSEIAEGSDEEYKIEVYEDDGL